MFVNLLIPRWRHPNAAIRCHAAAKLNPHKPAHVEKLWQLANHDPAPEVQRIAITRLNDIHRLLELLQREDRPLQSELAAMRLSELYEQQHLNLNTLADTGQFALTQLLCQSQNSLLHESLLPRIQQQPLLAKLAMQSSLAATRQQAAIRLEEDSCIESVRQYAKEHDKAVYRIIREHLKRKQQLETERQLAASQAEQFLQQLHSLLNQPEHPHLAARLEHLRQQWQQLPHTVTQAYTEFPKLSDKADALILQQQAAAAHEAQQRAAQAALTAQLNALDQQLQHSLQSLSSTSTQALQQLSDAFERIAADTLLTTEQKQCLEQLQQRLSWCQTLSEDADALTTSLQVSAEELDDTALQSLIGTVQQQLSTYYHWPTDTPRPELLLNLQRHLEQLQQQLQHRQQQAAEQAEIEQWQHFSIIAQKEQLCVAMETLIDIDLPPSDRAQQIRSLQQQWKALDHSNQVSVKSLWDRFHQAAQQAYEPCDQYFREQSRLRAWNLTQREQICTHLQSYFDTLDWQQPDWHALEAILKKAKMEWRRYAPVDRAPGKPLQLHFNSLIQQAETALDAHRAACAEAKQSLVDHAAQLAECDADELQSATQQLKQLQQQWKQLGATEHSRERQLWQAFRGHGDRLFARLRAQQDATDSTSSETDARLLCIRLEILLHQPSPETDQCLRMEYQMQRLEAALETPTTDQQLSELEQLRQMWKQQGFAESFPELDQRFQRLLQQTGKTE
ncbi:hypothetical protein ADINL_1413 [Nitrincola lacisaponensis]|uniref:DUF349 domain-containing protein n=1 Tax=Nitrincola lacisaponensis TaxID=267850 RepID=A0A063Y7T6_9GAMM|nr:DUF349 domain-containing protein [Nitrincola lacisaponensis]KDE40821.1 hypothetical protein ADINL_1413 [Nitrincola lacisaponensis]